MADWTAGDGGVRFTATGLGPAYFAIGGMPAGARCAVDVLPVEGGSPVLSRTVTASAAGRLEFDTTLRGYNRSFRVSIAPGGTP